MISDLRLRPWTVKAALPFVAEVHRRLPKVQGAMIAISVRCGDEVVGCALIGHPARVWMHDNATLSVLRVAVREGYPNACSMLYGASSRVMPEIYNDLDGEIVNVFRVLRDEALAVRLHALIGLTPFARAEFMLAAEQIDDPVERARRTIVRSFMGHGSDSITVPHTGFRANSNRNGSTAAHDWMRWPSTVPAFVERLRGVVIENRPAEEIIRQHDSADTLHYLDPPYPHSTRSTKSNRAMGAGRAHGYRHEMTDDEHRRLAGVVHVAEGMFVISGYPCALYDELYAGWQVLTRAANADGGRARTEALWISPNAYTQGRLAP